MKRSIPAASAVLFLLLAASCGGNNGPNVILILIDTVRADHFSCYGYHRQTTPSIDSLAAAGTIALRCQGQSSWTLPAMTTILSGVTPVEHGAGRTGGIFHGVSPDVPWLPLAFHRRGYRTAAFFNVLFMNEDFGFHRGFQHFDCQGLKSNSSLRNAGETVDDFLGWLDETDGDKPFFAAVHFYDPHIPYSPPEPWHSMYRDTSYSGEYGDTWGADAAQMMRVNSGETVPSTEDIYNLTALYDGEIAYTDMETGRLLGELRNRGLGENTIVLIVGDHGEEFLEHGGIEHGRSLYQELTHIPLVISGPGFTGGRVISQPVAQLDVAPTLAAAAGIDFPVSESSRLITSAVTPGRNIPASGVLWGESDLVSVVSDNAKVIWTLGTDSLEGFDLGNDPGETMPVPPSAAVVDAAEYYRATPPLGPAPVVDIGEAASRELRNLGYIR